MPSRLLHEAGDQKRLKALDDAGYTPLLDRISGEQRKSRLGDRYGLKSMLLAGLELFAVASLLCAIATKLWPLIGARVLQGAGAAVMMTTLVVGPFYLALGLGLTQPLVGFLMAVGPVIAIVSGVPSGRLVDSWGSGRVLAIRLAFLAAGAFLLAILPNTIGVAGYVPSIIVVTLGYQL